MIPPLPPERDDSFGARLRVARRRRRFPDGRRWTQGDLAAEVGVERNTVSRWENGGVRPKDPAVIGRLAELLNVSVSWLLDGFGAAGAPPAGGRTELRDGSSAEGYPARGVVSNPPSVDELIARYLRRAADAGCTPSQVAGCEALLLAGAHNTVATLPFESRTGADVAHDVDAAWDCVVRILRRDGIRA